ncbi:MAG: flagellar hook-length control protein FliK [Acidimicrobiales bacterium]
MPISSTTSTSTSTISSGSNGTSASKGTGGNQGAGFQLLMDQSSAQGGTEPTSGPSTASNLTEVNSPQADSSHASGSVVGSTKPTLSDRQAGSRSSSSTANTSLQGGELSVMAGLVALGSVLPHNVLTTPETKSASVNGPLTTPSSISGAPIVALDQAITTPETTSASVNGPLTTPSSVSGATETISLLSTQSPKTLTNAASSSTNSNQIDGAVTPPSNENRAAPTLEALITPLPASIGSVSQQVHTAVDAALGSQAVSDPRLVKGGATPDSPGGTVGGLSSLHLRGPDPAGTATPSSQAGAFGALAALAASPRGTQPVSSPPWTVAGETNLQWTGGTASDLGALASVVSAHVSTNPSLPSTLHLRLSPGELGTLEVVMSSSSSGLQIHMAASSPALVSVLNHSASELTAQLHAALGVSVHLELGGFGFGTGSNPGGTFKDGRFTGDRGAGSSSLDTNNVRIGPAQGVEPSSQVDSTRLLDVRM